MALLRTRLTLIALGCLLTAFHGGCSAPFTRNTAMDDARPKPTMWGGSDVEYFAPGSPEIDMAGVLDTLQQVREIDPAAEQKLVDELRRTPPKSWPLVAEQFRASLAYRERLKAKEATKQNVASPSTEPQVLETGYDAADSSLAKKQVASHDSRPSAPIGSLVDPRHADLDGVSSEAIAKATPYSTPDVVARTALEEPYVPREFAATDQALPIAAAPRDTTGDIVQTRLETVDDKTQLAPPTVNSDDRLDWRQHVEQAAQDLNERVAPSPTTTAEVHQHVSLRMLWLLAGDTEKALEPIPHISPGEQDYWSQQLFALATYLDHHTQPDDKRRAAAAVIRLDDAVTSLRELGSLTLRNLSFCKNVYGYGSIETFDADRFSPGEKLSLYVEVENYHSRSTEKGYCTSLGSTYEILDENAERVSGGTFPDVDDCCQGRRRDFHIQYGLTLPDKIAAGRYKLQLIVKDRQSDKIGHATASFEIRGSAQR